MSQLVQIQLYQAHPAYKAEALALAHVQRPREVTDLVDALSRMFKRIGMSAVCGDCFAGKEMRVGCATFMCELTTALFPHTRNFLTGRYFCEEQTSVIDLLRQSKAPVDFFPLALKRESEHRWTKRSLKLLRVLRHAVDAWEGE